MEILPIWKTNSSIGKSIITAEDELEIKSDSPVSLFAICRKYNLKKIVVLDDYFSGFPQLFKLSKKYDIQLIYGLNFTLCNDVSKKDEESKKSNCKISVLMKNSNGYTDLIKFHDAVNANAENFYYTPRADYSVLNNITYNLQLLIPPYDNFIHNNLLCNGCSIPQFGKLKPIFTYCNIELPYTQVLNPTIKNYSKNNGCECVEVWPINYYRKEDFKQYMVYRCINNRSKFSKPELDFLSSNEFCWQSYCDKNNIKYD